MSGTRSSVGALVAERDEANSPGRKDRPKGLVAYPCLPRIMVSVEPEGGRASHDLLCTSLMSISLTLLD
jgi:hypothetical protein